MTFKKDLLEIINNLRQEKSKIKAEDTVAEFLAELELNEYPKNLLVFIRPRLEAFVYTLGMPNGNENSRQLLELEQKLRL